MPRTLYESKLLHEDKNAWVAVPAGLRRVPPPAPPLGPKPKYKPLKKHKPPPPLMEADSYPYWQQRRDIARLEALQAPTTRRTQRLAAESMTAESGELSRTAPGGGVGTGLSTAGIRARDASAPFRKIKRHYKTDYTWMPANLMQAAIHDLEPNTTRDYEARLAAEAEAARLEEKEWQQIQAASTSPSAKRNRTNTAGSGSLFGSRGRSAKIYLPSRFDDEDGIPFPTDRELKYEEEEEMDQLFSTLMSASPARVSPAAHAERKTPEAKT